MASPAWPRRLKTGFLELVSRAMVPGVVDKNHTEYSGFLADGGIASNLAISQAVPFLDDVAFPSLQY